MNHDHPHALSRPLPFVNDSEATIPAFAVMAILGLVHENGLALLKCGQPDTTFRRHYAINGMQDVAAGRRGACYRAGDVRVLYAGGTPLAGTGWGPRPGQWTLAEGFPGATIQGVVDAEHSIARIDCDPINRALVKTTATIGIDVVSSDYRIYAGPTGSESDAGFTVLPPARNRSGQLIAAGQWAYLVWVHNGWELQPMRAATLCAVPTCGQDIPARVGNVPGQRECCLFMIAGDTLLPVLDEAGHPTRATVFNVRDVPVPPRVPPLERYVLVHPDASHRWVCEVPEQPGVASSTTTPNPSTVQSCAGTCKWTWNGSIWYLEDNGCSAATTTTTTPDPSIPCLCPVAPATTTTTADPETTTTPDPETTTTVEPTTTTTTTPAPCDCLYPDFCGDEVGQCAYTQCVRDPAEPNVNCTTTTTPDPLGPTTTTCLPANYPVEAPCECTFICTPFGWQLYDQGTCPAYITCSPPAEPCPAGAGGAPPGNGQGGGSACYGAGYGGFGGGAGGGGGGGIGGSGCEGCGEACYWWDPRSGNWVLVSGCGCTLCDPCGSPYVATCRSEPPSELGVGFSTMKTMPCTSACGPGAKTTTTSNPCGNGCKWQGDGEGGWDFIANYCSGGCVCALPTMPSHDDCEVVELPCVGTTTTSEPTTTTPPPTTTTTTEEPTTTTTTVEPTTTTTTTKPWYCVNILHDPDCDAATCIEVPNEDDPMDYGFVCSGPYETSGACNSACTPAPTTTTCDPNWFCDGNCIMTCSGIPGVWLAPVWPFDGPCHCCPTQEDEDLIGTPCSGVFPEAARAVQAGNYCEGSPFACPTTTTTTPAP